MPRNRRSLGRKISQSQRVNYLSDKGALLYTWMIPQYDDQGRMNGDPEDVKFNVVPRRGFTVEDVFNELTEMDRLELIYWYIVNDKPYIEMPKEAWEESQTFKGIKRQPSKIPTYNKSEHHKVINKYTFKGGALHPMGCTTPPDGEDDNTLPCPQEKLSKEKSFSSSEEKPLTADSHSKHFSKQVTGQHRDQIVKLGKSLSKKSNKKKSFEVWPWVQQKVGEGYHHQAIIDVLKSLLDRWDDVKDPWGWAQSVIKTRGPHYREAEFIQEAKEFKDSWTAFENSPEGRKLSSLLNPPHARAP
ncbi:MAG: hypothetical protein JRC68_06285 [Deltaproteobacteria bacterium]|nr:hypothetical protein [Deltaproteobacteria bacterium]